MVVINPINWLCFYFIETIIGLGNGKVVGLTISKVILMGKKVIISFYRMLL